MKTKQLKHPIALSEPEQAALLHPEEAWPDLSPAQGELCRAAAALSQAADGAQAALSQSYRELAEEAGGAGRGAEIDQSVQRIISSFKQINLSVIDTYQRTTAMEDELSARFRDMRKSRDRRWFLPNPPANGMIDLAEQQRNHFARGINLYKLLLVCFVGSFAGVVVETIWCLLRYGYLESRAGLIYGPFNLLYGVGAVALTVTLYRFRNRGRWLSFLGGMAVGSLVEYLCSWGQEALFGSRSWDYSAMPFNLNGRICLLYSCFWGILGVLWIKDIYPRMAKWILKLPNQAGRVFTWCLTLFLVFNAAMSLVTVWRWSERLEGAAPANSFWAAIDDRFPDERMERVYANMRFGKPSLPPEETQ